MRKKEGFTLIELLAVIVILAIIALIATPLILNLIDDARKNSARNSVYGYVEAVDLAIPSYISKEASSLPDGQYTIDGDGNLKLGEVELQVAHKGSKVSGTVTLQKNQMISGDFFVSDYAFMYDGSVVTEPPKYDDGTVVYFNPYTGKTCKESEATIGKNGQCMKWYIFGDSNETSVAKMILDHNFTNSAWINKTDFLAAGGTEEEWNSHTYTSGDNTYPTGNNTYGPITLINTLKNATSTWKAGLNPRVITATEIAKIVGKLDYDVTTSTSWFYLDGGKGTNPSWQTQIANATNKSDYAWLYDYTIGCEAYGCNKEDNNAAWGYWTSDAWAGGSWVAWLVNSHGSLLTPIQSMAMAFAQLFPSQNLSSPRYV